MAPGNSIGTLNVNGNFVQGGGSTYQVEVNAAGQSDRINVGGTATLNGGTVQVLAQPGTYARNTTYTILNATGGVSGAYSGVTSNFAFLTPTLAYDANNVFLNLFQSTSAFAAGAQTRQPVCRRHGARPGQRRRDRRSQHGAERAERAQQHRRARRRSTPSAASPMPISAR